MPYAERADIRHHDSVPDPTSQTPPTPAPDEKDWTWVIEQPCPDCGFAGALIAPGEFAIRIAAATAPWQEVLRRSDVRDRPAPTTWSPLEYSCHVRDVCRIFDERTRLMLTEIDPGFANWDQDATALEERYWEQDPAQVAADLATAATQLSRTYAAVPADAWGRTGRRSNGSAFTVTTLGRYLLHDLVHHLWDVGAAPLAREK